MYKYCIFKSIITALLIILNVTANQWSNNDYYQISKYNISTSVSSDSVNKTQSFCYTHLKADTHPAVM